MVAITLDAGGDAVAFPKMIAALNKSGIKVTFFLTGMWAQQNPTYVQQIAASGGVRRHGGLHRGGGIVVALGEGPGERRTGG